MRTSFSYSRVSFLREHSPMWTESTLPLTSWQLHINRACGRAMRQKCWLVNKWICLQDTIMESELKTGLNFQRLRYKDININYFLSQKPLKWHSTKRHHKTEKGSVIFILLSVELFTTKCFNILSPFHFYN